ncbi:MAG: tetratricopeptide repeat protein [Saprospiraceae bacterium]|nr:tetratricopeptide repeat protein [Saprospiraceae bacterium]MDZ4702998.1 tetratricopeptide repeat protein [Saprospiraceae bacterium]
MPNITMNIWVKLLFLTGTALLVGSGLQKIQAQSGQVDEKTVNLEKLLIEANLERLLGNYDKSIKLYEQVVKDDAANDAAYYELARLHNVKGADDEAIRFARKAVEIAPENQWYRRFLADIYQQVGRNKEAAGVYEYLVSNSPNDEEYYYKWAYFLLKANEIPKAIKVYDDLEKRSGLTEEIARRKHSLYVGIGDSKKAAVELERLVQAFPKDIENYYLLAAYYEQIGEAKLAEGVYRTILKININDPKASIALAGSGETGSDAQFLASLKTVFAQADVSIDYKIAKLLPYINKVADTGDKNVAAAAIELAQILETTHPGEAKAYAAHADLLYYSGQPEAALAKYKKTLELDETVYLVWEQVLRIQSEMADFKAVHSTAEQAMDIFPNKAFIYYMHGVAEFEQGRFPQSLSSLEQALLMSGKDGRLQLDIRVQMGKTYAEAGKATASNEAFEAALALHAKSAEALSAYAYCLALRGENLERAKQMAIMANELAPEQAKIQDVYGWVLYRSKDLQGAKTWIGKALENGGDRYSLILEHYGDVLYLLKDTETAFQYWTKAKEKGSRSKTLDKKITDRRLYEQ